MYPAKAPQRQPVHELRYRIAAFLLCIGLSACSTYDSAYYVHSVWRPIDAATKDSDVFFLTDRNRDRNMPGGFGYGLSGTASCGVVHASVPPARLPGGEPIVASEIGQTPIACGEDPGKLAAAIANAARAKNCNAVLIYVHGFDTGFETGVLRAAQIADDTQWVCAVAAFSWSSSGRKDTYDIDEARAEAAVPLFAALLNALADDGVRTSIVAHSIGARLVLQSLASQNGPRKLAAEVVFAAPDIGIGQTPDEFAKLDEKASQHFQRLTIYASREDVALATARRLNNFTERLGRAPRQAASYGIADAIDAHAATGDVWGHNYFHFSYEAMADISLALAGIPAEARIEPRPGGGPTLFRGENGISYRLNVAPKRQPDIFTRIFRLLAIAAVSL